MKGRFCLQGEAALTGQGVNDEKAATGLQHRQEVTGGVSCLCS